MFRWFKKYFSPTGYGAFVEVHLHYGFGRVEACGDPAERPAWRPCLHVVDRSEAEVVKALEGRRFDWGRIPHQLLAHLELGDQFVRAAWADIEGYLA